MPSKSLVTMTKAELLREHRRLIRILRYGTVADRLREASLQSKEAKRYT